jgi:hypothetical protein
MISLICIYVDISVLSSTFSVYSISRKEIPKTRDRSVQSTTVLYSQSNGWMLMLIIT